MNPTDPPRYEPYSSPQPASGMMTCPKCGGPMRTYERNGIHLEQCTGCRGVFLDFGELEHLTQLESRFAQQPPVQPGHGTAQPGYGQPGYGQPGYGPSWGHRDGHRYRRGGLSGLFFSS